MPQVHIGLLTVLYISNLLSMERWNLFPYEPVDFFRFLIHLFSFFDDVMSLVELAVKGESEISGLNFLLYISVISLYRGHLPFRRVNVVWMDFVSFTLILHFRSHFSMSIRWSCRLVEVVVGLSWEAKIAVSLANIPMRVLCGVGKSCV
jgi:hypothetical protein